MPSRRQALLGLGSIATAGIGYTLLSGNTAAVEIDGLNIPNEAHTNESGELSEILFSVDCSYSYDSNKELTETSLRLEVTYDSNWQTIQERSQNESIPQNASKDVSITGSLFDSGWTPSDFSVPEAGERRQQSIQVRVIFQAFREDSVAVEQVAETSVTIVLEHAEELQISAELAGSGEVKFTDAT